MNMMIVMEFYIHVVMYIITISHHRTPLPLVEGAAVLVLLLVAEAHLVAEVQTIGLEMIIPTIGVETIGVETIMKLQSIGMMVSTYSLFCVLVSNDFDWH